MANEITLTTPSIIVSKGSFYWRWEPGTLQFDMTGDGGGNPGLVSVGNGAEEDISFGDVTGEGYLFMQNLDATSDVDWGAKDTTMKVIGTLKAGGDIAFFRIEASATLRMQSVGAGDAKVFIARFEA